MSGYDLHFRHFDTPKLPAKRPEAHLRNACLIFIDSGGYELVPDFDSKEIKIYTYTAKVGCQKREYEAVLKNLIKLREPLPLVITNFDYDTKGRALDIQISEAQSIFNEFPTCISDFILKPWPSKGVKGKEVDPSNMSDTDVANLRGFDIIGVTEKELGKDILDRIKRISILRLRLDRAKVASPIHIWGGLDPIMTPLYFFAGAEIFNGVSWLRYAFRDGLAINREIYAMVSSIGVTASRQLNHAYASSDNLIFLGKLTNYLQQWVDFEGKRFDMFDPHVRENLENAYKIMVSKIDSLKGGL